MKTYKDKRRLRKIKKFGKKVGIAIIFLGISYLLSLLSFYLYTQLSQILQPVEKGFLGFAIIGLIAGLIAILVSLVNKRLQLTVVISFFIDCLVDSVFLFSRLGTQVIQFLPGLLIGMSTIVGSGYFLKRKLGLFDKNILALHSLKEKDYKKYALARKLLENPNKITMEVFKEACKLLQGIDPRIDGVLKEVDDFSRALTGDMLGFIITRIKTEKEKDKEKKEKVLFFIDLINDIKEEIDVAFVKLGASEAKNYVDHPIEQANHSFLANAMTTVSSSSVVATIVASSVIVTSAAGIIPGIPPLSQNMTPPSETQDSQEIIVPTQTATPTILPTETPKTVPILTYSTIEKTIFVSALDEGTTFNASSTGTYRFTITGGAYMADPAKGWEAKVMIYKNRPIDWSGPNGTHTNWDYLVGYPGDYYTDLKTREEAEQLGKGQHIDIFLNKNDYLIFIVFDSKGDFIDNSGGMYIQVQKGTLTTPTTLAMSDDKGFIPYAECTESSSIPNSSFPLLDVFGSGGTERPLINTVELESGKSYWVRMSIGFEGDNGQAEAITNKNNVTFSVSLNGNELKLRGDTKIEYYSFWEVKGYYCSGILAKGSHKIFGTSYLNGNYVDSASLILNAK